MDFIIKIADRPPDATGKVPAYASYLDKNFVNLEVGIETSARQGFFEGLVSSPELSASLLVISFSAFQCYTASGVYCALSSGSVTHDSADPTNPRIDIITVNPEVQLDGEGEIIATGKVVIIKGTAAANPLVPDVPPGYLKVAEVDIPDGASEVTLRGWKPMYVKEVMLRSTCQDTPNMTVKVNFFRGYICGNVLVEAEVQNSPEFSAPAAGKAKIDILHINNSGTLSITQGTAVDSPTEPSAPAYPEDEIVICEVFLQGGDTSILQWQIKDVRPWLWICT